MTQLGFFFLNHAPECLYLRWTVKWLLPLLRVDEPGSLVAIYVKPQSFSPSLAGCLRAPERQRNVKSFSRAQGSSLSSLADLPGWLGLILLPPRG